MTGQVNASMNNLSQDSFNKLVTIFLMSFFALMYTLSWLTGKPLDWQALLTFIIPSLNHVVHVLTSTTNNTQGVTS